MDSGGLNWTLIDIVGPLILVAVIAFVVLRNRRSRHDRADSEAATRRLYEEEEREHRGEGGNVP